MIKPSVTVDETIELLNEALKLDPKTITTLFDGFRVPCNKGIADHPTIQVTSRNRVVDEVAADGVATTSETTTLGLLGIINGMFGTNAEGWGPIQMTIEDDGTISSFGRSKGYPPFKVQGV